MWRCSIQLKIVPHAFCHNHRPYFISITLRLYSFFFQPSPLPLISLVITSQSIPFVVSNNSLRCHHYSISSFAVFITPSLFFDDFITPISSFEIFSKFPYHFHHYFDVQSFLYTANLFCYYAPIIFFVYIHSLSELLKNVLPIFYVVGILHTPVVCQIILFNLLYFVFPYIQYSIPEFIFIFLVIKKDIK